LPEWVIRSLLATGALGERPQPFALSGEKIPPLFGSFANAIGPTDVSSQVSGTELAQPVRPALGGGGKNPEFEEVREKLAEARAHEGIVRLSDIIKEREESKAGEAKSANGS